MIYPIKQIEESSIQYLSEVKSNKYIIYSLLLILTMAGLCSLPFLYIDISVKALGITRPTHERTEVKTFISGIIDSLFYAEGDLVQKNATLLRLKDPITKSKQTLNHFETTKRQQYIQDLVILTTHQPFLPSHIDQLITPLYKEQASRFIHQIIDQEASLKKANKELELNATLAKEKVISPKEYFDIQINQEKIESTYKVFIQEQLSIWQQDLANFRFELSQFQQQIQQVNADAGYFKILAPVSGIIQGLNTRYTGGLLQANEILCTISPEETIIGECYIETKDIGLLINGQTVRFQIEAFNYNYFGILSGKIISIDNDFSVINNKPFFKVRCSFDQSQIHLKNGFTAQLKKGLGFQASFVVSRRSLWHLLFDTLDDWLNPNAPIKKIMASK